MLQKQSVLRQHPPLVQDLYAVEGFSYQEKISLRKLKLLASNFSTVFAVLQGLPGSLPWGVLLTFLNDFLSQHKGMSIAQATLVRACCPGFFAAAH